MGISEEAARKRVSRATEQLRQSLAGEGYTVPLAALSGMLLTDLVSTAPESLATMISSSSIATGLSGSLNAASLAKAPVSMVIWNQIKLTALSSGREQTILWRKLRS